MNTDIAYKVGDKDTRPWGSWEVLDVGAGYIVKRLIVTPGGTLSLQRHQFRDEHWVIVGGSVFITINDDVSEYHYNDSVFMPRGTIHRAENRSGKDAVIIEVQTGDALREDDIERLEDQYGRT